MNIQLLSDIHNEFELYEISHTNADVIVLAGDIHVKEKGLKWALDQVKHKPVIYVMGNHEFYGKSYPRLVNSLKEQSKGTNCFILERDTITIDGINFLGCTLWTDFELFGDPRVTGYQCQQIMTDFKKIRVSPKFSKLRSIDVASIHHQSLAWLKQQLLEKKSMTNIVITHHGPSILSLPYGEIVDTSDAAYVSRLDSMIEECSPSLWVHGHLHSSSDYYIDSTRVVCNPRGYPGELNPDFIDGLIIEV